MTEGSFTIAKLNLSKSIDQNCSKMDRNLDKRLRELQIKIEHGFRIIGGDGNEIFYNPMNEYLVAKKPTEKTESFLYQPLVSKITWTALFIAFIAVTSAILDYFLFKHN